MKESLGKTDMAAVLSRTHFSASLEHFLYPIFEAISNSIDGIEERFGDDASKNGKIDVTLCNIENEFSAKIIDNGIGLTKNNFDAFKTPFTGNKLKKNGRGFGRFVSFKFFNNVHYESGYYANDGTLKVRSFTFDVYDDSEFNHNKPRISWSESGTVVTLSNVRDDWCKISKTSSKTKIFDEIGKHFLQEFLKRKLPQISLKFNDEPTSNITEHFRALFTPQQSGNFEVEIEGSLEKISYSLTRLPKNSSFLNHMMLLTAANRVVGEPQDLSIKVGTSYFKDKSNSEYIVAAVLSCPAFEARLNDSRTGINLSKSTIEKLVSKIAEIISEVEKEQHDAIKSIQRTALEETLKANPILRLGLRGKTVDEYLKSKPNNWSSENFIGDLAIHKNRESNAINKSIEAIKDGKIEYEKKFKEISDKIDARNRDSLAEYVIHRKSVLDLLDAFRSKINQDNYAAEDAIHDLIFQRFEDSSTQGYFSHNLWIIDDLLSFSPFISSDRSMHGKGRKLGDKIPDLVLFDDTLVVGDETSSSLSIVEFKRPGRDDNVFGNPKKDPIKQVIDTIRQATRLGGMERIDGARVNFKDVRKRFGFIIADITDSLVNVLNDHDFDNTINPKVFSKNFNNEKIYIELFGYETLLENSNKRNAAFFQALLGKVY